MKKLLFFFLLTPFLSMAQTTGFRPVNMKEIKKVVTESSAFKIDDLMRRYHAYDTTLNADDYFYLYYGYATTKEYNGYKSSELAPKLKKLLDQKEEDFSEKDFKKVIELSEKILLEVPFDIDNLSYIVFAYNRLGRKDEIQPIVKQYKGIIEAIQSTGDGKTEETAFWVTNVDNEYTLLRWLDFEFGGQQSLTSSYCDRLKVKKNDQDVEALYFNVTILFARMSEMFKEKK